MCEQSYDDDTREVNSKDDENGPRPNILVPGVTLESMVMAFGGAWIPPDGSGEFNVPAWAGFVGRSDYTIRNYLRDNPVDVRVIGDQQFVAPEAFRKAFPLIKSNTIARPGRGGNRRKKG